MQILINMHTTVTGQRNMARSRTQISNIMKHLGIYILYRKVKQALDNERKQLASVYLPVRFHNGLIWCKRILLNSARFAHQ